MRMNPRERLVHHVRQLERLEAAKEEAAAALRDAFAEAKRSGFDPGTLRAVLRLRKMSPEERKEKRALEAIYLASLGMLDGDPLTDEARRRLDAPPEPKPPRRDEPAGSPKPPKEDTPAPAKPAQPALPLKDPEEARQEGRDAAAAGKRIYDNPYAAGDPCRAAWDEGWCERSKSHGMDLPAAYQRRSAKPPGKDDDKDKDSGGDQSKDAA